MIPASVQLVCIATLLKIMELARAIPLMCTISAHQQMEVYIGTNSTFTCEILHQAPNATKDVIQCINDYTDCLIAPDNFKDKYTISRKSNGTIMCIRNQYEDLRLSCFNPYSDASHTHLEIPKGCNRQKTKYTDVADSGNPGGVNGSTNGTNVENQSDKTWIIIVVIVILITIGAGSVVAVVKYRKCRQTGKPEDKNGDEMQALNTAKEEASTNCDPLPSYSDTVEQQPCLTRSKIHKKKDIADFENGMPTDIDRLPTDKDLADIAETVGSGFELLAAYLEIPANIVDHIKTDNSRSVIQVFELFRKWKQRKGKDASLRMLLKSMKECTSLVVDWQGLETRLGVSLDENVTPVAKPLERLPRVLTSSVQPVQQTSVHSRTVTLELLVSADLSNIGHNEEEPYFTGIDFLLDGRLVAVDNKNCKCIVLNEQLNIIGTPYTFKAFPRDVASLTENEIAVTVANSYVYFLSVNTDSDITLIKTIKISTFVFSVCRLTSSSMVVGTYDDPRPARIISKDEGETDFDKIGSHRYKLGDSKSTFVTGSKTLVFTDRFDHSVYLYDTSHGGFKKVHDENIQQPRGVCAGPDDTVFVCSRNTNSIVQLNVAGEMLGNFPVDMKHPYSVALCKDASKLVVSNSFDGARKLNVYRLSL